MLIICSFQTLNSALYTNAIPLVYKVVTMFPNEGKQTNKQTRILAYHIVKNSDEENINRYDT